MRIGVTQRHRTNGRDRPRGLSLLLCLTLLHAFGVPVLASGDTDAAPPGPALVVRTEDGRELLSLPLARDPSWVLLWNHSVTGILVRDFYRYEDGRMLLTDSHTPAFDAGLGHIPGRGRLESDGANGYWIRDIDEPVPGDRYWLRVGSERVDHRIVHAGRTYSLSALAAGERVQILIEDVEGSDGG